MLNIYLKNGYASRNGDKDEYQNTNISYGQLDHNVGILNSELETIKMSFFFNPSLWNLIGLEKSIMWMITSLSYPRLILSLLWTISSQDLLMSLRSASKTFVCITSSSFFLLLKWSQGLSYVLLKWHHYVHSAERNHKEDCSRQEQVQNVFLLVGGATQVVKTQVYLLNCVNNF